jgi:hypothetical protein
MVWRWQQRFAEKASTVCCTTRPALPARPQSRQMWSHGWETIRDLCVGPR